MSENTPPPTYQIGDVVNGFRLTATDNGLQWLPTELPPGSEDPEPLQHTRKRKMPTWGWVGIGIAGVATVALITVGALSAFGSASEDRVAQPVASAESTASSRASEEPAAPAKPVVQELVLGETAFGVDTSSGYGWFVVAVENPNTDYVFANGQFTIEAFDAAGVLLDSSSEYTTLLAGRTMFAGNFLDVGVAQIDHIEVRGPTAASATFASAGSTGSMTTSITGSATEYGYTDVTGTVTSSFSVDQEYVQIYVIARDASGAITGGDIAYVERLPAGGTAQFSANLGRDAEGQTFEAYAAL